MKKNLSINFPTNRKGKSEPLFPEIQELRNIRRGHKISRFFRHVLGHSKIKRILGSNLALAMVATTIIPSSSAINTVELEQFVIPTENVQLTTEIASRHPLEKVVVNQGFYLFHPGIDYEGVTGDPVFPVRKGVVEAVQYSKYSYGNAIIVRHEENLSSLYAHLSKIDVEEGETVDTLTKIGEVGSTGRSTGDHLHLELREGAVPINPFSVLPRN